MVDRGQGIKLRGICTNVWAIMKYDLGLPPTSYDIAKSWMEQFFVSHGLNILYPVFMDHKDDGEMHFLGGLDAWGCGEYADRRRSLLKAMIEAATKDNV
jgi:hypothetical protein